MEDIINSITIFFSEWDDVIIELIKDVIIFLPILKNYEEIKMISMLIYKILTIGYYIYMIIYLSKTKIETNIYVKIIILIFGIIPIIINYCSSIY